MLDAGIDVFSTVNVQHLESLNDHVAELSGVRVRETIPDAVLGRADEVVLIDLTPEALLDRLRAGKVYPPERIDAALNNFFRIENLAALREVALRQVAEEVEAKRLVTELVGTREDDAGRRPRRRPSASGCWRWSSPTPARSGSCAARGARPSASAPSSTCCGSRRPAAADRRAGAPLRRCASSPPCSARPAGRGAATTSPTPSRASPRERGTTYILIGRSRPRARPRAPARAAPPAADAGAAGRRRPHRRRPRAATRGDAMNAAVVVAVVVVALRRRRSRRLVPAPASAAPARARLPRGTRRILLPFTGHAISRRAFDAAVRLARAEDATIMPAFLARVPRHLPLDAPLPAQCLQAMPLLEAIEQRASRRACRRRARQPRAHLPRRAAAAARRRALRPRDRLGHLERPQGLSGEDLEWMLEKVPAEVLILRPDPEDHRS